MTQIVDENGLYTITFKADEGTNNILSALGKHRGQTVHTVAAKIVEHWIAKTHRDIQRDESRAKRVAAFQSNAGIVTRPSIKKDDSA